MIVQHKVEYSEILPTVEALVLRQQRKVDAHNRKSVAHGVPASLTLTEWLKTLERYDWKCAYKCGRSYEVLHRLVPLAQGGGSTKVNCAPACRQCAEERGRVRQRVGQIGVELSAGAM